MREKGVWRCLLKSWNHNENRAFSANTERTMLGEKMRTTQACRRDITAIARGFKAIYQGPINGRHNRTPELKPEQKEWLRPL